MQTAAAAPTPGAVFFLSPSHNISCQINYHYAGTPDSTYCQTTTPQQSVTLSTNGKLNVCKGVQCEANPPVNAIVLPYGQATGLGPFSCQSAITGVTCLTAGRGFAISDTGIVPIGQ